MSQRLKELEDELGVLLIHREGKAWRVTPEGEALHQRAQFILSHVAGLEKNIGGRRLPEREAAEDVLESFAVRRLAVPGLVLALALITLENAYLSRTAQVVLRRVYDAHRPPGSDGTSAAD